ncbi:MAG: phosphoribosylamine--glycine ligase [Deltaproteobacteria bacterium]|nr:MAG: phosphoribosylamine--glycine ligase [Deltaproteobacteria bacterium]
MKVLVAGGGGREHILVWKISQSPQVKEVYCAPGNGGISQKAHCLDIEATDLQGLVRICKDHMIDLTVVGPELPLTMGIVDLFQGEGLKIFGANRAAAQIEGSKAFAKDLMRQYGIPSAEYQVFDNRDEAAAYISKKGAPIVVKADGLAAGKGVTVAETVQDALEALDRIMVKKVFGEAGERVVIEERLVGEEASFIAFSDGERVLPMASSQDHKPIYDDDKGPNTGGMGAYSPAPVVTPQVHQRIMQEIMIPAIKALAAEGYPYRGVLYAGLMIQDGVPKVLEFNCRFGDPETQPVLVRMNGDLIPIVEACIGGSLAGLRISWDPRAAVCVVMASQGYPGAYEKGKIIRGLEEAESTEGVYVFHAGTSFKDGEFLSAGGRVLGVTGLGRGIREAIEITYEAVSQINWEGVHYRRDIGKKALSWLEE